MCVSRSSVLQVYVEFTSVHGLARSPECIPCGIAQGVFCGWNCFFFCVGDVANQVHHCVGKQTECIIAFETISHDSPVYGSTTFYIVQQILGVR
jgi:hypothetical protein